jgi:two-component system, NtrC family, sensor histidine kinase KinB
MSMKGRTLLTATLRTKILLGYGLTMAFTAVVLAWGFIRLSELGRASDEILRENYKSILAAESMVGSVERQDSAVLMLLLGYQEEGLRQHRQYGSEFLQWLARAKDNITVEGEDEVVRAIDEKYGVFLSNVTELILIYQKDPRQAAVFYHETVFPGFVSVRDACSALRQINEGVMFRASERTQKIASRATWSMAIIGILTMSAGLGISLFLSNLLTRPLRQMMEAVHRVAERKYDAEIVAQSSDELGVLAREFNGMVRSLKAFHDLNVQQILAEKQKSEAIIRSIDDGIVVIDADMRLADLNPKAEELLQVDAEECRGRHFLQVVKNETLFDHISQSLDSGQPRVIEEGQDFFAVANGQERHYYHYSVTPVRSGADHPPGVVLVLRDVTKLKELDRLKSEFIMTASHELRTPLTGISMSIGLLVENALDKLNATERELLNVAREEAQRLKALVNDLLSLSRIEAGKISIELEDVSMSLLFEKAVAVLKTQADQASVELSYGEVESLSPVKADPNKITWVLTNLISNALRYTGAGGHIRLSAERVGPQLHISVSDDGTGIPYEFQSRVFDKFVQVGEAGSAGGSGLGLAICREIVRAHGGTIWVDSEPGEGSVFTFTLPVAV